MTFYLICPFVSDFKVRMNTEGSLAGRYKTDPSEKEKDELYLLRVGKMCASSNVFFFPILARNWGSCKKVVGAGMQAKDKVYNLIQPLGGRKRLLLE